ncbi:hypothetical protein F5X97DRAFT_344942 [Nemania serpens]|nr:hypothetical protein F5X97DRAFT_344942 [Nemania serpens]
MASHTKEYDPLPRGSDDESSVDILQLRRHRHRFTPWSWPIVLTVLLAISVTSNLFIVLRGVKQRNLTEADCPSTYAGLKRDVPTRIIPETEYTSDNVTEVADLWGKLRGDPGVLALSSDYVKEKGLPPAIPYPWDEDKSVYFFQAYHNLHCLRTLFRYVNYTETGVPNRIAASHALHCLDQLRQDVICHADDTPRYAWTQPPGTGFNQVRMCRDWSKLEKWATEHTACFKNTDGIAGPIIERFKSCPDGRVLWPTK